MEAGFRRECIRSAATCVIMSFGEILGNGRVNGKKSVVSEMRDFSVLGM